MNRKTLILLLVLLIPALSCSSNVRYAAGKKGSVKSSKKTARRANTGKILKGVASYYGKDFHGRKTANGETFDMYGLTAAHKTLPLGTRVRVTNMANGKSVIVKINDRGPFVAGRILDLSFEAAKRLGMIASGTADVQITILTSGK